MSFVEETVFAPLYCLFAPSLKISWLYLCGCILGLCVLFHWSLCLFFHWYHTVLITISLEVGSIIPPTLFFSVVWAILGLLPLSINCKNQFVIICKIISWDFYWNCIESIDQVGNNWHFNNIESFYSQTWNIFLLYLVVLLFHLSEFCSFPYINLIYIYIYIVRYT